MATSSTITMAAKELKNNTAKALRAAERGQRVIVTRRGRPVAVMIPAVPPPAEIEEVSYEEAWRDIEDALAKSEPRHRSWREAFAASRRRKR